MVSSDARLRNKVIAATLTSAFVPYAVSPIGKGHIGREAPRAPKEDEKEKRATNDVVWVASEIDRYVDPRNCFVELPLDRDDYYAGKYTNASIAAKEINENLSRLRPGQKVSLLADGCLTMDDGLGYIDTSLGRAAGACWTVSALDRLLLETKLVVDGGEEVPLILFPPGGRTEHRHGYRSYGGVTNEGEVFNSKGATIYLVRDREGNVASSSTDYTFIVNPRLSNFGISGIDISVKASTEKIGVEEPALGREASIGANISLLGDITDNVVLVKLEAQSQVDINNAYEQRLIDEEMASRIHISNRQGLQDTSTRPESIPPFFPPEPGDDYEVIDSGVVEEMQRLIEEIISNTEVGLVVRRYDPSGRLIYELTSKEDKFYPLASSIKALIAYYYFSVVPQSEWTVEGVVNSGSFDEDLYNMVVHSGNRETGNTLVEAARFDVERSGNPIQKFNDFLQSIGIQGGISVWQHGASCNDFDANFYQKPRNEMLIFDQMYSDPNVMSAKDLAQFYELLLPSLDQELSAQATRLLLGISNAYWDGWGNFAGYKSPIEDALRSSSNAFGKDGGISGGALDTFSDAMVLTNADGGHTIVSAMSAGMNTFHFRRYVKEIISILLDHDPKPIMIDKVPKEITPDMISPVAQARVFG